MSKRKLLHPDALWERSRANKSKLHFTPRRRGPAKITWPLAPKKALILLTGSGSLNRALDAYESFFRARRRSFHPSRPWTSHRIREQAMDGPWAKEFFRTEAEQYYLYPRKGFQVGRQKRRILKLFSDLGLKSPLS